MDRAPATPFLLHKHLDWPMSLWLTGKSTYDTQDSWPQDYFAAALIWDKPFCFAPLSTIWCPHNLRKIHVPNTSNNLPTLFFKKVTTLIRNMIIILCRGPIRWAYASSMLEDIHIITALITGYYSTQLCTGWSQTIEVDETRMHILCTVHFNMFKNRRHRAFTVFGGLCIVFGIINVSF